MSVRVSPTDRIHRHIDDLFAQDRPLPEILEEVARLGAQLLMQAALEAEVTEFLGRDRYARAATAGDARPGSRNGYRDVTVKTTAGPVKLARPKLRGTTEAFASRLFGSHVTKTNALESLVIASFIRGLSVRDVEATLADALGDQAAISKSTVSGICQQITGEYQAWATRRLDQITLDYLYLDASFFRMHPGSPAEPVLAAWGITTEGKPAFAGLAPGAGESADAWHDFLADLKDRGLASPLLVISDGAPGLISAIEQAYPKALRQRCLIHRARNILAALGRDARRLDLVVVADQVGIPLAGVAAQKAVKALESAAQRPPVERPGRGLELRRQQVVLADHERAVAAGQQHLGEEAVLERNSAVVSRVTGRELVDRRLRVRVVVAAGDDTRARRRAQRGGVRVRIQQAARGQGIQAGRGDRAAVTAELAVAGVVEHDHEHVRAARRGPQRRPATPGTTLAPSGRSRRGTPIPARIRSAPCRPVRARSGAGGSAARESPGTGQ